MAYYFRGSHSVLNPGGKVSSFKNLKMRATKSLAANLTKASKFENQKLKVQFRRATFSKGHPKLTEVPRML